MMIELILSNLIAIVIAVLGWTLYLRGRRIGFLTEHSRKLKDGVLEGWASGEYGDKESSVGTAGDIPVSIGPQSSVILAEGRSRTRSLQDPRLDFSPAVLEHLSTGYRSLYESWEALKIKARSLSERFSGFIDAIRERVRSEMNLAPYFFKGPEPASFVALDIVTYIAFEELSSSVGQGRKWIFDKAEIVTKNEGYVLECGGYHNLARSGDKAAIEECVKVMKRLIENKDMRERARTLLSAKNRFEKEYTKFVSHITEMSRSIEMGNSIRGKCRYCRLIYKGKPITN